MNLASAYLIIPVLFWGISYIAIKVVLTELDPVEMVSARFMLATPVLFIIIKLKRLNLWPVAMKGKLFFASIVVFLHFWVMATGMQETSASNTAWIQTTAPIFIAILGWAYLKEKFTVPQWIGLLIACSGVFGLIYNGDASNLAWINSRGDFIVLGSCVTWAFYTIGTRELTSKIHPLVVTFYLAGIAGLIFIPYTLFTTGYEKFLHLSFNVSISLIFLGIFSLAIAFWLWSEGLKRQTAAEVGIYLYIEPLFTMIFAWILIDESLTVWLILGAILISIGVYVSEKFGKLKITEHDV
ncbi:MAG: DMT family transporter [candidate division Zixibacteria bacterium]|nr:DMT family transporter [candidate division Zixibacteria bacterium]